MQFTYQTERLLLKILSADHSQAICDFYTQNRNFLEPFEPKHPENFFTEEFHRSNLNLEYRGFLTLTYLRYWLYLPDAYVDHHSIPIGSVCFSNVKRGAFQKCMLGYKLSETACHQGYMTEALSCLIPKVLDEMKLHRIESFVQPDNYPSIHLLSRLSFKEEGYLSSYAEINGKWTDHLIYSYLNPNSGNR